MKSQINNENNLNWHWVICTLDDRLIYQFEDTKENKFNLDYFKPNSLKYLSLYNKNTGKYFIVDLIEGSISYNTSEPLHSEQFNIKKSNIRLIFFRRHRIYTVPQNLSKNKEIIYYFLGYQYNDEKGNSKKVILRIDQEGNFIIGE